MEYPFNPLNVEKIASNPIMIGGTPYEMQVPGDGSCLLHAVCNAYCRIYITKNLNGIPIDPIQFVRKLRKQISLKLVEENLDDEEGRTYYESLARGTWPELSQTYADLTLEGLQAHFDSKNPLGVEILEFLSVLIDYDIYLIDKHLHDVYITGDEELYQKGRSAIIIIYDRVAKHYSTFSIKDDKERFWTVFLPEHIFIQSLKDRMKERRG